jgi:hypothetical protein
MNTKVIASAGLILGMVVPSTALAAKAPAQPQVRMNAQNIIRATEVIKRNPALFENPELLKKFIDMNKRMQKK